MICPCKCHSGLTLSSYTYLSIHTILSLDSTGSPLLVVTGGHRLNPLQHVLCGLVYGVLLAPILH